MEATQARGQHLDGYRGPEPSAHILRALQRHGRSSDGFPLYRLVQSEDVIELSGGLWNDWNADLEEQDRGGMVFNEDDPTKADVLRPSMHRPVRVVAELREVPKYCHLPEQGWVLERWYPPDYYGTPELYEAITVPGTNISRFGEFPHRGQYELAAGVFGVEPSLTFLDDFIAGWEQNRESFPQNITQHILEREHRARERDRRNTRRVIEENAYRMKHTMQINLSTNPEAGRYRQQAADRNGLHAHVGN